MQADRALINLRNMANDLDRHSYLTALQERNESLFYKLLVDNMKELLPIVHMPTVSEYCAKYALMFRSLPRALFISLKDKGINACMPGLSETDPECKQGVLANACLDVWKSTLDANVVGLLMMPGVMKPTLDANIVALLMSCCMTKAARGADKPTAALSTNSVKCMQPKKLCWHSIPCGYSNLH